MVIGLTAAAIAIVVLFCAPVVLKRGRWQVYYPALALGLWLGALMVGISLPLTAIGIVLLRSVTSDRTGTTGVTMGIFSWVGLLAIAWTITIAGSAAESLSRSARDMELDIIGDAESQETRSDFLLLRFEGPLPTATCYRGPPARVVISSGLEQLLSRSQLRALLAHELAHLTLRHDLALRLAEVNEACLPSWLPHGPALRGAVTLLIELAADDRAARQAGPANLANALELVHKKTGQQSLALRAQRIATKRWPRRARLPAPASIST